MKIVFLLKKGLTTELVLCIINFALSEKACDFNIGRGFNSVPRRSTQEAEEAPLLRV